MASPDSIDDTFKSRVAKIFGSLTPSQSSSPWTLTDDEIEKREWNRNKENPNRDDQTPCSSSFDRLFNNDRKRNRSKSIGKEIDDMNDDDVDDDDEVDDDDNDEWKIRSSIGLDCTLDNEEEEDEYDKLAEGKENTGDRIYMKDVTDHGPFLNSHNVLPNPVDVSPKESHANHDTAQISLKEDELATEKSESHQTCDESMLDAEEPCIKPSEDSVEAKPKSILKRKDNSTVKFSKRVRFDPSCKDHCEEASEKNPSFSKASGDDDFLSAKNAPRVPDYVVNPSKYVRYSFDSPSDIHKASNVLEQKLEDNESVDIPKSVMFIPRKKISDAKAEINSSELKQNPSSVKIAALEVEENEVDVIGEDEQESDPAGKSASFQKPGRNYRTKSSFEDTVS